MKTHLLRNMFIVGSAALALAASTIVLPSVADAKTGGVRTQSHSVGHVAGNYRGRPGRGNYRGPGGPAYYGGYDGGYYGGYCPPIIGLLTGACLPYGY